jgi:hypothetical protein
MAQGPVQRVKACGQPHRPTDSVILYIIVVSERLSVLLNAHSNVRLLAVVFPHSTDRLNYTLITVDY